MKKEIKEKIENNEYKIMDLWDLICSEVGFDKKGKEIQLDIRAFVELKVEQSNQKWAEEKLKTKISKSELYIRGLSEEAISWIKNK